MVENYISEIVLNNFRNYSNRKFKFENGFNIIVGSNGVGKTNLLESISMFSNSKGMRNADTNELTSFGVNSKLLPSDVKFSIFLKFNNSEQLLLLQKNDKKIFNYDKKKLKSAKDLSSILKITYLLPQMDNFFTDGKSNRRKFLDKTSDLLFVNHYENVKKYDFFIKERMKILLTQNSKDKWLDIVEKKISELGVAIAAVRNEIISYLNEIFCTYNTEFPSSNLILIGEVEKMLMRYKSLEVEEYYKKTLLKNRNIDTISKKTNFGTHRSDILMLNKRKGIEANLCSTGEQKMLLLSLIIARVIFSKQIDKGLTILILDEICSHIDYTTREKLFYELGKLNIQIFMSGIDLNDFKPIKNDLNNIIKL